MLILIPYMPENSILGHIDESAKANKKFWLRCQIYGT